MYADDHDERHQRCAHAPPVGAAYPRCNEWGTRPGSRSESSISPTAGQRGSLAAIRSAATLHAPARNRTWIYRLGGGRLIHWTTRARPCASAALAFARKASEG